MTSSYNSTSIPFSGRPFVHSKKWHTNPVRIKVPDNPLGVQFIRTYHADPGKIQEAIRKAQGSTKVSKQDPLQGRASSKLPGHARRRGHVDPDDVAKFLELLGKENIPPIPGSRVAQQ